jgi:uncharacterized membrane protein
MLGLYPSWTLYVFKKWRKKKMNVSLEYSKTLAGEGSILLLLSLIPYAGWILGIIGVILLLRGMKELSNYYQDEEIYKSSLTGVKFYIIALVAAAVAIAAIVLGIGSASGFTFKPGFAPTIGFGIGLAAFLGGLIIAFIFYVLATTQLRTTFNKLAQKSGESSFKTAGTLLWWGAILSIVLVGLALIFIAWIFATIGFFTMKPQQQQPFNPTQYPYTPPSAQPVQGKVIESKGISHNNNAQSETLGGSGI